jgi:hypothetical protein
MPDAPKKQWSTPTLIVLAKMTMDESVLCSCKVGVPCEETVVGAS